MVFVLPAAAHREAIIFDCQVDIFISVIQLSDLIIDLIGKIFVVIVFEQGLQAGQSAHFGAGTQLLDADPVEVSVEGHFEGCIAVNDTGIIFISLGIFVVQFLQLCQYECKAESLGFIVCIFNGLASHYFAIGVVLHVYIIL